uniref:Uncharacterized protein n=1 Tax=Neogobius melanostomus TaxID=47308 RepID=A0A8C6WQ84_9GOBI
MVVLLSLLQHIPKIQMVWQLFWGVRQCSLCTSALVRFFLLMKVTVPHRFSKSSHALQLYSYYYVIIIVTVKLPARVTPSGVVFVVQWILVAVLTYWIVTLSYQLISSTLRRAFWLLKISVALFFFVLILRDYGVGTETMAIRMTVLVLVCVLLGVGSSGGSGAEDKAAQLEEQVRILQRRLQEMERSKMIDFYI